MIVAVKVPLVPNPVTGGVPYDETFHENIAAVVAGPTGIRLCRDGHSDEWLDKDAIVIVTP